MGQRGTYLAGRIRDGKLAVGRDERAVGLIAQGNVQTLGKAESGSL
ncbi:MAG: hypothetical protein ACRDSZ_03250 [Pseudonocardiaceae bacterium]